MTMDFKDQTELFMKPRLLTYNYQLASIFKINLLLT